MLELWLIRHGMTEGNKTGKYIGVTDEPLCPEGRKALMERSYPPVRLVFVSPLLRCRETAEILFPQTKTVMIKDLAECSFGRFENKNYKDLAGDPQYQAWIDSNGTLPFPGGESQEEFKARVLEGFHAALEQCRLDCVQSAAFVVHGGTIMTIMERYGKPEKSFYEWHVKNGGSWHVYVEETGSFSLLPMKEG